MSPVRPVNHKGLQKARGPARAHSWMGRAMGPNLGPARRSGPPVGPPLKKYIYIYKKSYNISNIYITNAK